MKTHRFTKFLAIVVAAGFIVPATVSTASARTCKGYMVLKTGSKKWTNQNARLSARWAWHKRVRNNVGWRWSSYALAKNKGFICYRSGAKWRCTAYGRPCKLN